ncbi:MAG: hypothetical protein R3C49_19330 [Planctomycetaceae bacterium]
MRLADPAYCENLVAAGIDEYFISVTAADAETHDRITEVPGSFEKTTRALRNLDQIPGVRLMTNTVVTRLSYRTVPEVIDLFSDLKQLIQMDFWGYWPMEEDGNPELLVSHLEVRPYLKELIRRARRLIGISKSKTFRPACWARTLGL